MFCACLYTQLSLGCLCGEGPVPEAPSLNFLLHLSSSWGHGWMGNLGSILKRRFGTIGVECTQFLELLFGQRRTAEFSLVFLSVVLGLSTRWETETSKLAKMTFIGQETVRKQHRHNLNGNSRTSITRTRITRTTFPFPWKKFHWNSNYPLSRTVFRFPSK